MLKKIAMGTALATLIAVPTFATHSYASEATPAADALAHYDANTASRASAAYAYMPGTLSRSDRVYVSGKYVGQDPDANVRLQLRHRNPLSY